METEENNNRENTRNPAPQKDEKWLDKAEAKIDEAAEKIHQSETYRKADKKLEEVTKKVFRKAGRWWGKW